MKHITDPHDSNVGLLCNKGFLEEKPLNLSAANSVFDPEDEAATELLSSRPLAWKKNEDNVFCLIAGLPFGELTAEPFLLLFDGNDEGLFPELCRLEAFDDPSIGLLLN